MEYIYIYIYIYLGTSNKDLTAYVETANLDGEKALKKKSIPYPKINKRFQKCEIYFHGELACMPPTRPLTTFQAKITELNRENDQYPLTEKQLLLKGAKLKNTEWIVGCVAYTGSHTKMLLNSAEGRNKQSMVEKLMNMLIIMVLCCQIGICIILASLSSWWHETTIEENHDYIAYEEKAEVTWIIKFFAYFLLLNTFIPISLVVTLEVVKFLQLFIIEWDTFMYTHDNDK